MIDQVDDTIVALASPPGRGTVGIVRLSGPGAMRIAAGLVDTRQRLESLPTASRAAGEVIGEGIRLPAYFLLFRRPHSYTGQDVVEIHTVGSPPALELVLGRAVTLGARPAEPGEFTARAFLTGRMDLTRCEAVAAVIRAESDTQLRASRHLMDGALHGRITDCRSALSELVALIEADIDFSEEPIDFITPAELRPRLATVAQRLQALENEAISAERMDAVPHVLLFGPPNAGKSTLLNVLSGTNRAICAAAAGTTRDVLPAPVQLPGIEAIFLDAAGVDGSRDALAVLARGATLSKVERVDLVCLTVDASAPDVDDARALVASVETPAVVVANKADLLRADRREEVRARLAAWKVGPACVVSAKTGLGLAELRSTVSARLAPATETVGGRCLVLGVRQRSAIREAGEALTRAIGLAAEASETVDCADLLAFELRGALDALGTVTGEVTTDDLLEQVFAGFCIGK